MQHHLLGIEGKSAAELLAFLDTANNFAEIARRDLKKVPALRGKTVVNLFLEPSTRTRTSFEIAGKWLSADVINVSASGSSVQKGETLRDTALTLQAMSPDVIVIRHKESGSALFLAQRLQRSAIINAGDGTHEHPTQALLDLLTLKQHFASQDRGIQGLRISIVGDVRHSRVARSNIWAHLALGNEIRLVGPPTLVPPELVGPKCFGNAVKIVHNLREGVRGADVVMCLRMQLERQEEAFVPSLQEYTDEYCVSERLLKELAPQSVVMHPGPVNRGTEISSDVVDGPRSLIERQVANGVVVRMTALFQAITGSRSGEQISSEGM